MESADSGRRMSVFVVVSQLDAAVILQRFANMQKSQIQQVIAELPEKVDVDALIERLHLLDKIDQAEQQLVRDESVSHESARLRFDQWLR